MSLRESSTLLSIAPYNENKPSSGASRISRRTLLQGAAGLAATATIASSVGLVGCGSDDDEVATLMVADEKIVSFADFTELDANGRYNLDEIFYLPAGSMLWMASDDFAVVLEPGETSSPLSCVSFLDVMTSNRTVVLSEAVSHAEGYEIYEVRASSRLMIWTEYNYLTSDWRVYTAVVTGTNAISEATLVDMGDIDYDPPLLCVEGEHAIWMVLPYEYGPYRTGDSLVKDWTISTGFVRTLYTSHGRPITIPERDEGIITIVPRLDTNGIYYVLTALDANSGSIVSQVTLPQGVKVFNAIYLKGAFCFSLEASYDSESAITKFGTFRDLGNGTFFRLNRVPSCTPAYCNDFLVSKLGKGTAVIDLKNHEYFAIPARDGSLSFGDFLASSGTCKRIVTYATVHDPEGIEDDYTVARLFTIY